jgi:penicillin amidase
VPGDSGVVRAHGPTYGASERFAVSPGHEREGIFHMPGSQSAHPWSPYYLAGHDAWLHGRAAPFLPGPTRWTLELRPAPRNRP